MPENETGMLLDHLFRQSAGRLTAHVTRLLGPARLDLAEEIVQDWYDASVCASRRGLTRGSPEYSVGGVVFTHGSQCRDATWLRHEALTARKQRELMGRAARARDLCRSPGFRRRSVERADSQDDLLRPVFEGLVIKEIPRDAKRGSESCRKRRGSSALRETARAFLDGGLEATIAQRLLPRQAADSHDPQVAQSGDAVQKKRYRSRRARCEAAAAGWSCTVGFNEGRMSAS